MSYLAIARKWRPGAFEDLVGQSHVVQTLKNAIATGRVSHAYLFSGARGVGKTSVARILAKALRCPNAQQGIPCNHCQECLDINEGRAVDVVEIDGASNNGVESVRNLRENVAYGAASGQYKIYIIDEVHMLSLSAFNALLKTLEEPPAHVVFLFATTEVQKIPLTILSRCQRFDFRRLQTSEIAARLQLILAQENVALTEEATRLVSTHADGSLRDALSLLDQVISFLGSQKKETPIEATQISQALGLSQTSHATDFLTAVLNKDPMTAIRLIEQVYQSGVDLKHFAERILEELRWTYLLTVARAQKQTVTAADLDLSGSHFEILEKLSLKASVTQIERSAQIFTKAIQQLQWASLPRLILEMATVRMSQLEDLENISVSIPASVAEVEEPISDAHSPVQVAPRPVAKAVPPPTPMASPPSSDDFSERWKGFVDKVMRKRPLLGALLSHAGFQLEVVDKTKRIVLAFPPGSFYERQATDAKYREDITNALKGYFGPEVELALSSDGKGTTQSLAATEAQEIQSLKREALEHPSVKKAQEILGAEVVHVQVDGA